MGHKAQISMEYLIILGFVFAALVPMSLVYYSHTQKTEDEVVSRQLDNIVKEIGDAAESVYYFGTPSQMSLKVYIPGDIASASIEGNELRFFTDSSSGFQSEISHYLPINVTGDLPQKKGLYIITVKAETDYVNVSYQ